MSRSHPSPIGRGRRQIDAESAERERIWREATTMVLYVSIVLLATLAALPAGHDEAADPVRGPVGGELIAIVWGTTLGLAVAHWFAFHVATRGFGGELRDQVFKETAAQLVGCAFVAAVTSLPVLLFRQEVEQRAVPFALALIIGGVGYLVERVHGRARGASAVFGAMTLLLALLVVTLKVLLSGH